MSDDLFLRYGRAVFEAERKAQERDNLFIEIRELATSAATKPATFSTAARPNHKLPRYRGAISEVARRLGILPASVSHVLSGKHRSAAITAALREEFERRDNAAIAPALQAQMVTPEERSLFLAGGRYFGIKTKVARELNLSTSRIQQVLVGVSPSERILAALRREMIAADLRATSGVTSGEPALRPLSPAERKLFQRGGPYFGAFARIGKALGCTGGAVQAVARGKNATPRILDAIRTEMACVDEGIRNGGAL